MAPVFTFTNLDWESDNCERMEELLRKQYNMPDQEWLEGADTTFGILRHYFEVGTSEAWKGVGPMDFSEKDSTGHQQNDSQEAITVKEEPARSVDRGAPDHRPNVAKPTQDTAAIKTPSDSNENEEPQQRLSDATQDPADSTEQATSQRFIDAREARESVLPIVKILKWGSYMMEVTATCEPLVCKAIGTISTTRYQEIFWERVEQIHLDGVNLGVFGAESQSAHEVTFFLRLGDFEFQLRYLQWERLVREYPNIIDAPPSFVRNVTELTRFLPIIENLQQDVERSKQMDIKHGSRLAYYYIRAWAINRGLYRTKYVEGDQSISPYSIVDRLVVANPSSPYEGFVSHPTHTHGTDTKDACFMAEFVFRFFGHFNDDYSPTGPLLLGDRPYPEDAAKDLIELLEKLRAQSVQSKMGCQLYLRINIMLMGSDIQGGLWLRNIESKLKYLKRDILKFEMFDNKVTVHPWEDRLVAPSSQSDPDDTYEGFWVFGIKGPEKLLEEAAFNSIARKWQEKLCVESRMQSTGENDGAWYSIYIDTLTTAEMDEPFLVKCEKNWPYAPTKPPERPGLMEAMTSSNTSARTVQKHQENNTGEPTKHLRPADDVLNRLRFDRENFKIDEWVVGYEDRHMEYIQGKPATAWVTDTTHEAFIPTHRIEYFKQVPAVGAPVIMWEKSTKTDHIFTNQKGKGKAVEDEADEEPRVKTNVKKWYKKVTGRK